MKVELLAERDYGFGKKNCQRVECNRQTEVDVGACQIDSEYSKHEMTAQGKYMIGTASLKQR